MFVGTDGYLFSSKQPMRRRNLLLCDERWCVLRVHIQIAWRQPGCWADPRHMILVMNCILVSVFAGLHIDAKFKYGYSRATIPDTT